MVNLVPANSIGLELGLGLVLGFVLGVGSASTTFSQIPGRPNTSSATKALYTTYICCFTCTMEQVLKPACNWASNLDECLVKVKYLQFLISHFEFVVH